MKYLTEKDLLVQKIEEIIAREAPLSAHDDPEIARLCQARRVLLGQEEVASAGEQSAGQFSAGLNSKELDVNTNMVDEFGLVYQFLHSLKGEKDHGKAILGLIEAVLFVLTIVTALSAKEADRARR